MNKRARSVAALLVVMGLGVTAAMVVAVITVINSVDFMGLV
jgi:hypothetical protein